MRERRTHFLVRRAGRLVALCTPDEGQARPFMTRRADDVDCVRCTLFRARDASADDDLARSRRLGRRRKGDEEE